MRKSYFLLIVLLILNYSFSKGQTLSSSQAAISDSLSNFPKDSLSTSDCQIRDINDVIRKVFKKNVSAKEACTPKLKKLNLLIIPSLSSNPANGFMVGINSTGTWHFGTQKNTRMSKANAKVVYTTNSQLMAYLKTSIYTKNNNYFLQGDVRYYLYSLPTYGIGTNAPDTTYEANFSWMDVEHAGGGGSYPMKYNFLIFHQLVNRKI